mmetsp:Transcript_12927/g.36432  ORF Transcript_12927/g.36432 Transcript_12927/m.36432 type:complete len:101 (-) Transcript_12927:335-637(-)
MHMCSRGTECFHRVVAEEAVGWLLVGWSIGLDHLIGLFPPNRAGGLGSSNEWELFVRKATQHNGIERNGMETGSACEIGQWNERKIKAEQHIRGVCAKKF